MGAPAYGEYDEMEDGIPKVVETPSTHFRRMSELAEADQGSMMALTMFGLSGGSHDGSSYRTGRVMTLSELDGDESPED